MRYEILWVEKVHRRVIVEAEDAVEAEMIAWEMPPDRVEETRLEVDNGSIRIAPAMLEEV